ncbi:MAG TPA: penicillin-binding transpeptidase domain-containing protein [Aggregatilineales bacterium]|nr:hypothetical protein [Anaerolineales bacterium]HRE47366.1 penicillin-binding transpeptidase domain-containing protein [Aggregatilineales bacterium]
MAQTQSTCHPNHRRPLSLFSLMMALALILSACRPNPAAPDAATPFIPVGRLPLIEAQRAAADFLNAWAAENFDAMYALLTANSKDAYSRDGFEREYRATAKTLTLKRLTYTLTSAIHQGTFADIAYDLHIETDLFGIFTDSARLLQFVAMPEGWRLAWTPAYIFSEFKDGAALEVITTATNRGNIYDRDGFTIADQNGQLIVVTLRTQKYPTNDPERCFAALAEVFPLRSAERLKTIYGAATGRDFAYEVGVLSLEVFEEKHLFLEQHCTLEYANRPARRYIAGGLAPHVVGYVGRIPAERIDEWLARGYSPDALIGIDGIERFWESALAGRGEVTLRLRLGAKTRILASIPAIPSQSVYLTLKRDFQLVVQNALKEAWEESAWGQYSPGGAAVVLDVRTGEVLAIASYPTFDVDAFNPNTALPNAQALLRQWTNDPRKPTLNRAALGQYAPGSVFKIVTVAAGLDSGAFTLNQRYYCGGIWNGTRLGDRERKDWIANTDQRQHGSITLSQALTGSCNIYMWHIAWSLNGSDPNTLIDHALRMGFGAPTGIRDIAEAPGYIPNPATYPQVAGRAWRGSDALNAAIGQGDIVVSPLQIARMVAAVANDGTLYQPLLVREVGIIGAPSYTAEPIANGQLTFKPGVLQGIRAAMCAVMTDARYGTAYFVFKDYDGGAVICGKTGTAETGGLPHAWFAAFAGKRADEPEIAVVVIAERSNEGSYIAAPIVRRIIESYYNQPITPYPPWYQGGLPNLTGD